MGKWQRGSEEVREGGRKGGREGKGEREEEGYRDQLCRNYPDFSWTGEPDINVCTAYICLYDWQVQ